MLQRRVGWLTSLTIWIFTPALFPVECVAAPDAQPAALARSQAQSTLRRVTLEDPPLWTVSGAFSADGSELLLVDSLRSEIAAFSLEGKRLGTVPRPPEIPQEEYKPSYIQKLASGYLLEYNTAQFALFDDAFSMMKKVDFRGAEGEDGAILLSSYQWRAVGEKYLLAFGDVREKEGWSSRFVRLDLDDPREFITIRKIEIADPARKFYLLGNPYIASAEGDVGAYLYLGASPPELSVLSVPTLREERTIQSAVAEAASLPELPEESSFADFVKVYRALGSKDTISGIWGAGGNFFVLVRKVVSASATTDGSRVRWSVRRVPVAPDEPIVELPLRRIDSDYLLVVQGSSYVAFIEKGEVTGIAEQAVLGLSLFPADLF